MRGLIAAAFVIAAGPAAAHDGVAHATPAEAAAHAAAGIVAKAGPPTPFPVEIVASFDLIDQDGAPRSEADFAGRPFLLFFGYASCEAICSVALPRMGETLDLLGEEGAGLGAAMITIDPERDTPGAMAEALARIHPRLVGLTGSEAALAAARAAFQVEAAEAFRDPAGQPVYAHGSFVYLVGRDGRVAELMPPILGAEAMAAMARRHL